MKHSIIFKLPLFMIVAIGLVLNAQAMEDSVESKGSAGMTRRIYIQQAPEAPQRNLLGTLQDGAWNLWDYTWNSKTVKFARTHPRATAAIGVGIITVTLGTVIYVFDQSTEAKGKKFIPLQTGEFLVQYPSALSTMNSLNVAPDLCHTSRLGVKVIDYLTSQGYTGDFNNFHIIDINRLGTGKWPGMYSWVVANCTRTCSDFAKKATGFLCKQISDRIFGESFGMNLTYVIPSGNYEAPGIERWYPLASYPDLYSQCKAFLNFSW